MSESRINGEYHIPSFRLEELRQKFARLNRKAIKCGCQPILMVCDEANPEVRIVGYIPDGIDPTKKQPVTADFVTVHISGEQPKFNGWRLIARMIHEDTAAAGAPAVALTVPGETLPVRFRTLGTVCEHCNKVRNRKDTFVVAHDDGTYKAVGSSCLADFLGHADPAELAELAEIYTSFDGVFGFDPDGDEFNDLEGGFRRGIITVPLQYIVALARSYSRHYGWVTSKQAQEGGGRSSAGILMAIAFNRNPKDNFLREVIATCVVTDEDEKFATDAIGWASALKPSDDNTFEQNINAIALSKVLTYRTFGFGCAIVGAYRRHVEQESKFAGNRANSEHFGTIGERVVLDLFLVSSKSFDGQFGVSTIHRFNDETGHTFIWWTSTEKDLPEGQWMRIKGTIKKHSEFRGFRQTELSRCERLPNADEQATLDSLSDDAKRAIVWAYNPRHSYSYIRSDSDRFICRDNIANRSEVPTQGNVNEIPVTVADFYGEDETQPVVAELLRLNWIELAEGKISRYTQTDCTISVSWQPDFQPDKVNPVGTWRYLDEDFVGWKLRVDVIPEHMLKSIKAPAVKKARAKKATA